MRPGFFRSSQSPQSPQFARLFGAIACLGFHSRHACADRWPRSPAAHTRQLFANTTRLPTLAQYAPIMVQSLCTIKHIVSDKLGHSPIQIRTPEVDLGAHPEPACLCLNAACACSPVRRAASHHWRPIRRWVRRAQNEKPRPGTRGDGGQGFRLPGGRRHHPGRGAYG